MKTSDFLSFWLVFSLAGVSLAVTVEEEATTFHTSEVAMVQRPQSPSVQSSRAPAGLAPTEDSFQAPPPRTSWRCAHIPDEAFIKLGEATLKRSAWKKQAADFMHRYARFCPSFSSFSNELPPRLNKVRYTQFLATLFEMEKEERLEVLSRKARGDESAPLRHNAPSGKFIATQKQQTEAAQMVLERRFPELIKRNSEALAFLKDFLHTYLDERGEVRKQIIPLLRTKVRKLTQQQKLDLKSYINRVLAHNEYPSAKILRDEYAMKRNNLKGRRLASLTRAETQRIGAIKVLYWEVE